jgi:hypothetical protein
MLFFDCVAYMHLNGRIIVNSELGRIWRGGGSKHVSSTSEQIEETHEKPLA